MAVWNFKDHAISSVKNTILLIVIYIGYIGVFIQMIRTSFNWASPYIEMKNLVKERLWNLMVSGK